MAFKSRAYEVTATLATPSWGTVAASIEHTILGLYITNKTTTERWVTVKVVKAAGNGGGSAEIAHQVAVPPGDRLNVVNDSEGKMILEPADQIQFQAEAASALDVLYSYLETDRS